MSHIIAGDPAPANPTAEALLEVMAFRLATGTALVEPNQFAAAVAAHRAEVLTKAADVLTNTNPDRSSDFSDGVEWAVDALLALVAAGGTR